MIDIQKFVEQLYRIVVHNELWVPLGIMVISFSWLGFWFGRYFPRNPPTNQMSCLDIKDISKFSVYGMFSIFYRKDKKKYNELTKSIDKIFNDEIDLWRLHEPNPFYGYSVPINRSRAKIIVVANNKGGVGKTTITTALAAYFERRKGKRVLLVDLDYQGSLSAWMIRSCGITIPENQSSHLALANDLIDGTALNHWQPLLLGNKNNRFEIQRAQLITADYTLTQHEMKLMLRWLADGGSPDIRFHVAQTLQSDIIQNEKNGFDVVLIDAPPRLSTSAICALTAATHLVVPTVLDMVSTETIGSFLRQAWELRSKLNPGLELAGVVGTKTPARPLGNKLGPTEQDAIGQIMSGCGQWMAGSHVFNTDIQNRAEIRKSAGIRNPYFCSGLVEEMFNNFGDELCERIKL